MEKIKEVDAREILDSRGNPTVEAIIKTESSISKASVPSGASKGKYEAYELRDKGKRYFGKGVMKAVNNIKKIISKIIKGLEPDFEVIDNLLIKADGTENKRRLGANAILAISLASCRLAASLSKKELFQYIAEKVGNKRLTLPRAMFNIINGGIHAGNKLAFQEFMIVPKARKFSENLRIASEVYHELKKVISKKYGKQAINIGDEGGFAPPLNKVEEPLKLIMKAASNLSYEKKIDLAIDCAASQFYKNNYYFVDGKKLSKERLFKLYEDLVKRYNIFSIEDPLQENDFIGFAELKKALKIQIVGDDLTVTNPERIKKAIQSNAINALLLKVNQIGTLSEAIKAYKLVKEKNMAVIVSHRSGETNDSFIADLSVALNAEFIKAGAPCRGERLAKYNRLLEIEEKIIKSKN